MVHWARELVVDRTVLVYAPPLFARVGPRLGPVRLFGDVPALETVLIDRKDLPSAGAGETPLISLAPAVGNAICHATGVRLRSLPLVPNGFRAT